MPKHSCDLGEIEAVLKVYSSHASWLDNDTFKTELKAIIGSGQYPSSYTKKVQIPSYFGFTVWKDITKSHSPRRITDSGRKFYSALIAHNQSDVIELLVESLEKTIFGRNNCGSPESDSDVEPPCLAVRGVLDLGYLTPSEFGYLLYSVADCSDKYENAIKAIKKARSKGINIRLSIPADKLASYTDAKPLTFLKKIDFFDSSDTSKYVFKPSLLKKYKSRLKALSIYNTSKVSVNDDLKAVVYDDTAYQESIRGGSDDIDLSEDRTSLNDRAPVAASHSGGKRYKTIPRIGKAALKKCGYECEYGKLKGETHTTFKGTKGHNYLEPHHLIPMKAQVDFPGKNLDREENIVGLCPNCHSAIHYGDEATRKAVLKVLYDARIDLLRKCSHHIDITFDDLFEKYYK